MPSSSGGGMGSHGKLIFLLLILGAAGGGYYWYSHGLKAKTEEQLFEAIAGGGTGGGLAEAELTLRSKTDKTTAETFRAHVRDTSPKSRIAAINGLAAKKDKDSAGALIAILKDVKEDVDVREAAARSFADIRVKDAVVPLMDVLKPGATGTSEKLRESASNSLRSITGQSFSNKEYDKWANWWESNGKTFEVKG